MPQITWNNKLKIIFADVDETVADLFTAATLEMCGEIEKILEKGIVIFFITGQSLDSVKCRIIDYLRPELRKRILVGHCNGTEVWGFDERGNVNEKPFYSLYENALTKEQKGRWREVVNEIIEKFKFNVYEVMPISEFQSKTHNDPLAIMLEDRGPQITFELVNSCNLAPEQEEKLKFQVPNTHGSLDLRIPVIEEISQSLKENGIPITPRLGGMFAIDLAVEGVSKGSAIQYILNDDKILSALELTKKDLKPENMEVWGDKFSQARGGADRHMSEALPKSVRSITFRAEDPSEFSEGYNILVWDGQKYLHEGLLEFLKQTE